VGAIVQFPEETSLRLAASLLSSFRSETTKQT
jgi:hypothetical protein